MSVQSTCPATKGGLPLATSNVLNMAGWLPPLYNNCTTIQSSPSWCFYFQSGGTFITPEGENSEFQINYLMCHWGTPVGFGTA